MKSNLDEAIAQAFFWSGIGSAALTGYAVIWAFKNKTRWKSLALLTLTSITTNHCLWWFKTLGTSLAHKVGKYTTPSWWEFLPYGIIVAVILIVIHTVWRHYKPAEQAGAGYPPQSVGSPDP